MTEARLQALQKMINDRLDQILAETLSKLRSFTRSVGQRTRSRT